MIRRLKVPENWYSNKELFEKIDALDNKIDCLRTDLEATRILIRDYNSLRQKVEETAVKVNTLMWLTPIAIAATGLLFTALSFILK
jgi:tetrahydromethanopterin S-methyltransferase subunit B